MLFRWQIERLRKEGSRLLEEEKERLKTELLATKDGAFLALCWPSSMFHLQMQLKKKQISQPSG